MQSVTLSPGVRFVLPKSYDSSEFVVAAGSIAAAVSDLAVHVAVVPDPDPANNAHWQVYAGTPVDPAAAFRCDALGNVRKALFSALGGTVYYL